MSTAVTKTSPTPAKRKPTIRQSALPKPPLAKSKKAPASEPASQPKPRSLSKTSASIKMKTPAKAPAKAATKNAAKPAGKTAPKSTPTPKPAAKKSEAKTKSAPQHAGRVPLSDPGPAEMLGRITWLMLQSPAHKHLFLSDLEWRVLPPVLLKQMRLFRKGKTPIGYAAWAMVDDETDARLSTGDVRLKPHQWNSGDHLWLIDLIAPMGGDKAMLKELSGKVFKSRPFKTLMPSKDGKGVQVVEIGTQK